MHELDSSYDPSLPLTELQRQRILAERILPEPLGPVSREEAVIAGKFALGIAKFIVRIGGPAMRRAVDNRLLEFDLSGVGSDQPIITVTHRAARESDDSLTAIFKFLPDRIEKSLKFSPDGRLDYQSEADFGDLSRLANHIHLSIPMSA